MPLKLFSPVLRISADEESIATAGTLLHNLEIRLFLRFYHLIFSTDICTQTLIKSPFCLSFDKLNGLSSLSLWLKDNFFLSGIICVKFWFFFFTLVRISISLLKCTYDTGFHILICISATLPYSSLTYTAKDHTRPFCHDFILGAQVVFLCAGLLSEFIFFSRSHCSFLKNVT